MSNIGIAANLFQPSGKCLTLPVYQQGSREKYVLYYERKTRRVR